MGLLQERVDRPTEAVGETDRGDEYHIPLEIVFDVLKNERRRFVLRYLAAHDEPVTISDLSEAIAAIETGKPVEQLSSLERKRVYVGL